MIWWSAAALAGELTGTVTDDAGRALAGATVAAYDVRLQYQLVTTDAAGRFTFTGIDDPRRVRAIAPAGEDLAEQYWPAGQDLCSAVPVAPGDDLAIALPPGAVLTGLLVDEAGAPVVGATVVAAPISDTSGVDPRRATSSADGTFRIAGVTGGALDTAFRIEISRSDLPTQQFPGVYDRDLAEPFEAPAGGTVDAGTGIVHAGVSVSGTVTGPGGPVASGTAEVYSPSQLRLVPILGGAYEAVGLPPGDVLVWATSTGLATTYWPDQDRPVDRAPAEDGDHLVLDLAMPAEAAISGRLAGGPFTDASVVAYNSDRTVGVGAVVAEDGAFRVGALFGGSYTLSIYAEDAGLVEGALLGADGSERALTVPAGGELDLGTLAIPPAGRVVGTVTDRYSGEPAYGASIYARNRASGEIRAATAGPDGAYAIPGLPPGDYELWVDYQAYCAGDPDWAPRWYPDGATDELGAGIEVAAGADATWDARVAPDRDGDGMDDVWEAEHGLDPTIDDSGLDPDGDGFTNLEEYQLGTDPSAVAPAEGCGCRTAPGDPRWLGLLALAALRRRRA